MVADIGIDEVSRPLALVVHVTGGLKSQLSLSQERGFVCHKCEVKF
jgi:hypothetical protein